MGDEMSDKPKVMTPQDSDIVSSLRHKGRLDARIVYNMICAGFSTGENVYRDKRYKAALGRCETRTAQIAVILAKYR
jgi:hypothetical protein